jgi:uncharacterized surface protein with fasciclin (FAS1) repeats
LGPRRSFFLSRRKAKEHPMTPNPANPNPTSGVSWSAGPVKGTLYDFTTSTNEFTTFNRAVKAAGLTDQLKAPGPYTLFAPTDAAFARLPQGTLDNLMKPENKGRLATVIGQHIVTEKIAPDDLTKPHEARTLAGPPAKLVNDHGTVMVGDAHVVQPEPAKCSNGNVYPVDRVIIPAA